MVTNFNDTATMGIFGLSWQEKLAAKMYADTGEKALKSFFGPGGWNTGLVNKINGAYSDAVSKGFTGAMLDIYVSGKTGVSTALVQSFAKNKGIALTEAEKGSIGSIISTANTTVRIFAIGAAIIGIAYLVNTIPRFSPQIEGDCK